MSHQQALQPGLGHPALSEQLREMREAEKERHTQCLELIHTHTARLKVYHTHLLIEGTPPDHTPTVGCKGCVCEAVGAACGGDPETGVSL